MSASEEGAEPGAVARPAWQEVWGQGLGSLLLVAAGPLCLEECGEGSGYD